MPGLIYDQGREASGFTPTIYFNGLKKPDDLVDMVFF
jgi:hypothetical protein